MTIDHERLLNAMESRMEEMGLNQQQACDQMGLSTGIFRRLKHYKKMYVETYAIIINWLRADLKEYLV